MKARIIHTSVPQGSKLSPTLLSFYLADMPRPTEQKVNIYLTEMSRFLSENSLLISAPKSSVTLFTPDPAQANTRPKIKIAVEPMMLADNRKATLQELHTDAVNKAAKDKNMGLVDLPHLINDSEKYLTRK